MMLPAWEAFTEAGEVRRVRFVVPLIDQVTGERQTMVAELSPLEVMTAAEGPGGIDGPVAKGYAACIAMANMPAWLQPDVSGIYRLAENGE